MVRDGAAVTCHSWSAAEQLWKKVGDVVGASGGTTETSGKVLHDGKVSQEAVPLWEGERRWMVDGGIVLEWMMFTGEVC